MHRTRPLALASILASLACAPRVAEPVAADVAAPPPEPSVPVCEAIVLESFAAFAVEEIEAQSFRFDSDRSRWDDPRSVALLFGDEERSAYVGAAALASTEDIDVALTLPTGDAVADLVPLTDEQLAGIGARAAGFTLSRVTYRDHPRGTRRYIWDFTEVDFTRCGLVVRIGAQGEPPMLLYVARSLDRWLAMRCGHTDATVCVAPD